MTATPGAVPAAADTRSSSGPATAIDLARIGTACVTAGASAATGAGVVAVLCSDNTGATSATGAGGSSTGAAGIVTSGCHGDSAAGVIGISERGTRICAPGAPARRKRGRGEEAGRPCEPAPSPGGRGETDLDVAGGEYAHPPRRIRGERALQPLGVAAPAEEDEVPRRKREVRRLRPLEREQRARGRVRAAAAAAVPPLPALAGQRVQDLRAGPYQVSRFQAGPSIRQPRV